MRETKFRGKSNKTDDCMIVHGYGCYTDQNSRYFILVDDEFGIMRPVQVESIDRYTGRKDKHGAEIYEGDIVDGLDELAEIQWDDDTARYIIAMSNVIYDFDNTYPRELEVIVNTYENPELLKEE